MAISGLFTEEKSTKNWLKNGWHVAVGYVLGYLVMLAVLGWHAHPLKEAHGGAGGPKPAASGHR